jgi:hypothetical protein
MALRFLADHCVSNSTVQTLREAQHEVFRLRDVLPVESSDAIVLAKASGNRSGPDFSGWRLRRYHQLPAERL